MLLKNPFSKKLLLSSLFFFFTLCLIYSQDIIYPSNGSANEFLAAKEVRRYIYLRTGQHLKLEGYTIFPESGDIILVANNNNSMIEELSLGYTLKPGETLIKSVEENGRNVLIISGYNSDALLVAAYRFAEHLGVGFGLAGDVIPDTRIPLDIKGFDEVGTPLFETRGIQPFHDFLHGPDIWSTNDYKAIIAQLPKMGMNFIGLHTYPTWSTTEEKERDERQGPESTVWIGLPEDINEDGTVSWSYPSFYAHTQNTKSWWGASTGKTENFYAGSSELFSRNGYGSDALGTSYPTDLASSNKIFNNVGTMFNESFELAKNIGVKTAVGTELPLGLEPAGGTEVGTDWIRGMPPLLQERLDQKGKDPRNYDVVEEVYEGIFKRISKMHHLDYYWLWTWEVWQYWEATPEQIAAYKSDITSAYKALENLNHPFQLGMAGWMLGSFEDPAEFDNTLPKSSPFMGLWDEASGFEELSNERIKWPATWLEEDWGLGQPQLNIGRIYDDTKAALNKGGHGLIAKHWRTNILSVNLMAMEDMVWSYGTLASPPVKSVPESKNDWIDSVYIDWTTTYFGPEAAEAIANVFIPLEKAGEPGSDGALPQVLDWEGPPGAIIENEETTWEQEKSKFSFVDDLEALRSEIVGKGNLERYDYWLKTMQAFRFMGEFATVRYAYMNALDDEDAATALSKRKELARLWEKIMPLHMERITNVTDLGAILSLEILNWKMLIQTKTDEWLSSVIGSEIPTDANPSKNYTGDKFIKVIPPETLINKGDSLILEVIAMGIESTPVLKYRLLGETNWDSINLSSVARSVYEVTIPAQPNDFEYYIESGMTVFPVTAPDINQTVVVADRSIQAPQYILTVVDTANGTISAKEGAYDEGQTAMLKALPDSGYKFRNWTGDLTGSLNPVYVAMDRDKTISANFGELQEFTLTTEIEGEGSIRISPEGTTHLEDTRVRLKAIPDQGYIFKFWLLGDQTITEDSISFIMNEDKTIKVWFAEDPSSDIHSPKDGSNVHIKVFPNPAISDFIYIKGGGLKEKTTIELIDLKGYTVRNQKYVSDENERIKYTLEGVEPGVYILRIVSTDLVRYDQLMIIK